MRRARFGPCALVALLSLVAAMPARASLVTPLDTEALVRLSTLVVRAEVESVVCGPGDGGALDTWVTLHVAESLKGAEGRARVTLRLPGGEWRGRLDRVYGVPTFEPGERVVVFASTTRKGHLVVTGLFQGKYRIEGAPGHEEVVQAPAGEARFAGGPQAEATVPARMALEAFLGRVRDLAGLYPPPGAEVVPDTPPAVAVEPSFSLLNPVIPLRWFEPDVGTPITLRFNGTGAPVSASVARAGFEAGLAHWTGVTGSTVVVADGGDTTQACRIFNDGSVVSHGDPCGQIPAFDPVSCSGVLAVTGVSGFTLQTRSVNGVTFLRMTEADIVMNADTECFFAGPDAAANYEEVLTHEMGHVIGLGHSCGDSFTPACVPGTEADDALMRAIAHGGGRGGAPRADDIDGARFIYPPPGFVDAFLNASSFTTGDTLALKADVNGRAAADVYILLVLPGGGFVSLAPGLPVNTFVPAAQSVPLRFATDVPLVSFAFGGAEAPGSYKWVVLLVQPGTDPTHPANWLGGDSVPFTFAP